MADDGLKITIRVTPEEIQILEEYMLDHGIANRSDLVRDAIRNYIGIESGETHVPEGLGVFVHFTSLLMSVLSNLVKQGICVSEEEFIRKCVLDVIVPEEANYKAIDEAFALAKVSALNK
ncbi:MAG: ribbon-helix-helix protein, CopG family [Candidatus Methanomethylophilaceae archaeon]|nr:ribbon-helix-helix protein, CopG family [Candidatus Methanomethylophilaceae archaeon]